jgi:hypothetical protein
MATDKSGLKLTAVETTLEVTVPIFTLTNFVPVVDDLSVKGIATEAPTAIDVVLVQLTVVVPLHAKALAPPPDNAGTSVMPGGKMLLTVVVPLEAVDPVSVSVAVYGMLVLT